jgi:predicted O-methyltransferase YrrM
MPWPYPDSYRVDTIENCKRYWSYESPFPDYDVIANYNLRNRNIYSKLNINYTQNLNLIESFYNIYIPNWNPYNENSDIIYTKNPKYNLSYPEYDGFILYSMIRHFKPKRIIEIGSGQSTRLMKQSIEDEKINTSVTCIDKYTSSEIKNNLKKLNVNFIDEDIVAVDLSIFDKLEENDICFIDSSHVLKNYGDVELEILTILPSLKKGVIVHVHDIFLPYNYPPIWVIDWKCVLTEQQLLAAYLHNNKDIEILSANHYNTTNTKIPDAIEFKIGGSFWFRV